MHRLGVFDVKSNFNFSSNSGTGISRWRSSGGKVESVMGVLEKDEDQGLQFVRLGNGRRICYKELGVSGQEAKRHLMVLHGVGSSRLANMPGVSEELLKGYGVRMIAIDRPGYGRSDIDRKQTFKSTAEDIEEIANSLQMGEKIWLLGYSGGGAYCWAAARYIPHRIAGIAGWAPVGNYQWKGITHKERKAWLDTCSNDTRLLFGLGHRIPHWMKRVHTRYLIRPGSHWLQSVRTKLSEPDKKHLEIAKHGDSLVVDNMESLNFNKGFGMYKDLALWTQDWGFEPEDVTKAYNGKYHIWQGTEDNLVPVGLQRWIKSKVPELVDLHEIPDEGHLSWFCYNSEAHYRTFETLFGEDRKRASL